MAAFFRLEIDNNITVRIEMRFSTRRDKAGCVVLFNDTWPGPWFSEIGTMDYGCIEPASGRPEISISVWQGAGWSAAFRCNPLRNSRTVGYSHSDQLGIDQFNRFFRPGSVTVCTFMLLAERFFQLGNLFEIEISVGRKNIQFENLSFIMHVGRPSKTHLVIGEAVDFLLFTRLVF